MHTPPMAGRGTVVWLFCAAGCCATAALGDTPPPSAPNAPKRPSLSEALAKLQVPPPWFAQTPVEWDTGKPWKDARLHIRKLLAQADEGASRQAVKLTYVYMQKQDIGDGHEYPMYLFLGGQVAWATREYEAFLRRKPERNTHAYLDLAACCRHFGEHEKAKATLERALKNLPPQPWRTINEADVQDHLGDLHAETGDRKAARAHYAAAMELYPRSRQPYGRHLLPRRVEKVKAKLDMLDLDEIGSGGCRDGRYSGASLGYKGPLSVTVTVRDGRIADVRVTHKEDIHQNAPTLIPRRILDAQSLKVDGVTGATVTSQAIVGAAFQALKRARTR